MGTIDVLEISKMSIIPGIGLAVFIFLIMWIRNRFMFKGKIKNELDDENLRVEMEALAAQKIELRTDSENNNEGKAEYQKPDDEYLEGEPL
ncbi:hypothetical protein KAU08_12620 [bacterium]|nr:hypothetical protein [bacterium]